VHSLYVAFMDIGFQEHVICEVVPSDIILFTVNLFLNVLRHIGTM
jgi:hypothetical protein